MHIILSKYNIKQNILINKSLLLRIMNKIDTISYEFEFIKKLELKLEFSKEVIFEMNCIKLLNKVT